MRALIVFANLASIGCLWWALSDSEISKLSHELRTLDWRWVCAGAAADILVYCVQGWRWRILLSPIANLRVTQTIRAIYVGLFANEILPFRTGEVIRCYLLNRWAKVPLPVVLSSALVERIFDGVWLILFFALTAIFTPLPAFVGHFAWILSLLVLVLVGLLVTVFVARRWSERLVAKWPGLVRLIHDLHAMGKSKSFYWAFLASLPYLLLQVGPVYALIRAFRLESETASGLGMAAVVTVVLRLGTVVPSAPGNLGTFQLLAAQALTLFIADQALAKRFSFLLWGLVTLPLLFGGFVAMALTGLKLRELQRQAQGVR
ncbi:MAG: flippase-like domain-containing protein [Bryobacteraceae bacterium]|nr:flippase-like domain-containing protein [Bryobacteraceae bacterium]